MTILLWISCPNSSRDSAPGLASSRSPNKKNLAAGYLIFTSRAAATYSHTPFSARRRPMKIKLTTREGGVEYVYSVDQGQYRLIHRPCGPMSTGCISRQRLLVGNRYSTFFSCVFPIQRGAQGLFRIDLTMNQPYLCRPFTHARNELDQLALIGMC